MTETNEINENQIEQTTNALENLITQVKPINPSSESLENCITQVKPEALPQSPSRTRFPEVIADVPDNIKVKQETPKEKRKSIFEKIKKPSIVNHNSKVNNHSIWLKIFNCCGNNYKDIIHEEKEKSIKESKQPSIKAPELVEALPLKDDSNESSKNIDLNEPRLSVSSETSTTLPSVKKYLLDPIAEEQKGKKCLVLDLDETLVHSSFKLVDKADFIIPVEIEHQIHNVYVAKRPGVDEFMKKMSEVYEIVIFTASLSKYADPVLDQLDIHKTVNHRLFRESCYNHNGNYVKDLSQLGRPLKSTIIIDNSPASYAFHPQNAIPISSWFNDVHDTELTDLIPFLEDLAKVDSVIDILNSNE